MFTDGVFDITPSEQPQQKVKQQSESVTDPINTNRNRFAGQQFVKMIIKFNYKNIKLLYKSMN